MSSDESFLISQTMTYVDGAELSHHSTDQQKQRARIPHFPASPESIDRAAEGSNQNDCPPVKYRRYRTEAESTQLEYMHRSQQTEGPRRQGQVESPVLQPELGALVPVDARESGGSTRSRPPYGRDAQSNKHITYGTAVACSKRQTWTRKASQHLHSHDPG